MTEIDRAELRKLAEAASGYVWKAWKPRLSDTRDAGKAFILAVSPATVLALLDEIERLREFEASALELTERDLADKEELRRQRDEARAEVSGMVGADLNYAASIQRLARERKTDLPDEAFEGGWTSTSRNRQRISAIVDRMDLVTPDDELLDAVAGMIDQAERERDEARAELERAGAEEIDDLDRLIRTELALEAAQQAKAELVAGLRKAMRLIDDVAHSAVVISSDEASLRVLLAKHAPAEGAAQQWPKSDVAGNVIDTGPPAEGESPPRDVAGSLAAGIANVLDGLDGDGMQAHLTIGEQCDPKDVAGLWFRTLRDLLIEHAPLHCPPQRLPGGVGEPAEGEGGGQ